LPGYSRVTITVASARIIGAMLGPAEMKTREDYLKAFPA
jgi:hypothetical protein